MLWENLTWKVAVAPSRVSDFFRMWGGVLVIAVYDSLNRRMTELVPQRPGHVSIYTCGVTPYDHTHLGHARPAVVWDVIRRHLMRRGYIVSYVQNFTDIDDKLIQRSRETGRSIESLAEEYIAEYHALTLELSVEPPDFAPRVSGNLDAIVDYIRRLIESEYAYSADGSVYFRVSRDPEYGRLSGRNLNDMREGFRIDPDPFKERAEDFALWKKSQVDEPGWESPWGKGRPGWHIECSAMARRYLGARFDLHGGGMDLLFPHHENERAQSRALLGGEPVSIWVHSGLITQGGVKMSKSLKNGVNVGALLERYSPHVVRTYLLSVHYRSPLDYDDARISEWGQGLARIERLWEEVRLAPPTQDLPEEEWAQELALFEERFLSTLDEDFNTARAFAVVFDMVAATYRGIESGRGEAARAWARRNLLVADSILGFLAPVKPATTDGYLADTLVERRNQARQEGNFQWADMLRDVLIQSGYEVLDGPHGTRLFRREDTHAKPTPKKQ